MRCLNKTYSGLPKEELLIRSIWGWNGSPQGLVNSLSPTLSSRHEKTTWEEHCRRIYGRITSISWAGRSLRYPFPNLKFYHNYSVNSSPHTALYNTQCYSFLLGGPIAQVNPSKLPLNLQGNGSSPKA